MRCASMDVPSEQDALKSQEWHLETELRELSSSEKPDVSSINILKEKLKLIRIRIKRLGHSGRYERLPSYSPGREASIQHEHRINVGLEQGGNLIKGNIPKWRVSRKTTILSCIVFGSTVCLVIYLTL